VPFGKAPKLLDPAGLEAYAASLLAQRAISSGELRQKLSARALDPTTVEPLITRLTEYGALDDSRFAESYAMARRENQLYGRQRILRDLGRKRIPAPLARDTVNRIFPASSEEDLINDFLQRKFRGKDLSAWLADPKHLQSALRRLHTAGHSLSASLKVLRRYSSRAHDLDAEDL
jgi:regulatory protein